ncbi:host cell division inhibitor Icd-like protein [Xenorhabdus sp. PB30.3]|uniref:host cell division inhibitor Icd-like protein n=1 Tax=Xenorhabdus sp. PB30.3 TaxID=2788941 RepID=UPI001E4B505B|nr:host cell division inhibitor Icd-like protein [Xenorhabdus sp. PB30.3]MCC8379126.1 host cell division inhibitor Icd-like protein [Xenorhabdus sp. PB30.3]
MINRHCTHLRPKSYKFLFCAQPRTVRISCPERVSVIAASLDDARRIIAPHYIAAYAGHVPIWHDA